MKKYSLILLALFTILSCEKDDFEKISDFSKPQLFTPSINELNETSITNEIPIAINDFSSISDVSQGLVSRTWTIDEGVFYLDSEFKREDSLNLAPFIDKNLGRANSAQTIHALFTTPGVKEITLKQSFNSPVNFLGKDAVQEGDLWVLENIFTYNVFEDLNAEASISNADGSVELGKLTASQNPDKANSSSFETITIEAGTSLTFTDLSTVGQPTGRVWNFEGGNPATSANDVEIVSFNRLGDYTVDITTTRDRQAGSLRAAEQTKTIPLLIKVIPSTQPLIISGNAVATDDSPVLGTNIINFSINGELEPFVGAEDEFIVNVTNTGFNANLAVVSAKVSRKDATVVELILEEPIYNTDTVTLSYNGTTITSIDTRELNTFDNVIVDPLRKNFLQSASNPSFETASSNPIIALLFGHRTFGGRQNPDNTYIYSRSTERSSDGGASVKVHALFPLAGGPGLTNTILGSSNAPAGSYTFTFDVFIEETSTINGVFVAFANSDNTVVDLTGVTKGEWVTVETERVFTDNVGGNLNFVIRNGDNGTVPAGYQTFYIDNLKLIINEMRP
ncbi:hypothetical protein A8C32_07645 [Flavivirga aquatica]|uniref:PKD domain-containing protein n=1 Tax=Flavivirga aquatica TaxID=1849968 RepID=A0A1E5SIW1_9FLAO|nr:hypothetical protein [Flavivirga aquatica]OEJ99041.1 hypothetical protein A8C32_07645 [Flavivirga aquatica]